MREELVTLIEYLRNPRDNSPWSLQQVALKTQILQGKPRRDTLEEYDREVTKRNIVLDTVLRGDQRSAELRDFPQKYAVEVLELYRAWHEMYQLVVQVKGAMPSTR